MTDGSLAMHEARQAAGQRRRALVLAATDAALQRAAHPSIAGIARSAGVGRKFIYDHPDLRAEVELKLSQGAKAQAADLVSTAQVSAASLRAELENSRAQCQRLSRQVRFLEDRLSRAEGNRLASDGLLPDALIAGFADRGLAARISELEQQLFEAREALRRTTEELEGARAINRELMQQANRPRSERETGGPRRHRRPGGAPTSKEDLS